MHFKAILNKELKQMDNIKWFVGIFETPNGKRIGISEYYDQEEIEQIKNKEILREEVLVYDLTEEEADRESRRLSKELNIKMFDNMIDSF
jgi:hypothetical protein